MRAKPKSQYSLPRVEGASEGSEVDKQLKELPQFMTSMMAHKIPHRTRSFYTRPLML